MKKLNLKLKNIFQLKKLSKRRPEYLSLIQGELEERLLRGKLLNEVKKELKK